MKIAVCFKIIADYDRMSENDWKWGADYFVDTGFVRRVFNCFDESALETALTLSRAFENSPESCELTALTVDDEQADLFLRHLTAVGYDHAARIRVSERLDLRFNPGLVADLIARYVHMADQQMVILGMQGAEGDNGQTGFFVAERLGWPCIREVTDVVRAGSSDLLTVSSRIDGGMLQQTVKTPVVLIMGHSLNSPCLRLPTLKQKLNAKKKALILVSDTDLGRDKKALPQTDKTLLGLHRPNRGRSCLFMEGNSVQEQVQQLYDQFLKNRMFR